MLVLYWSRNYCVTNACTTRHVHVSCSPISKSSIISKYGILYLVPYIVSHTPNSTARYCLDNFFRLEHISVGGMAHNNSSPSVHTDP